MAVFALAQEKPSSESFHSKVASAYSFSPHLLSKSEIQEKSKVLDQVWKIVQDEPSTRLPWLRKELLDQSNSSFFKYDGSKLLINLSKDRDDLQLALDSIPSVDLQDIDPTDYLRTVHWLSRQGLNTAKAAIRILDFPEFKAFIPQHALTLGQDYSFIYALFSLDDSEFLPALLARLKSEANPKSQKSLLQGICYTCTNTGRDAIEAFALDNSRPRESREYAQHLLKLLKAGSKSPKPSAMAKLKEKRKATLAGISDEALYDFDELTKKMLRL